MTHDNKELSEPFSVRLKELSAPLKVVSDKENVKPAKIIRRALRLYLGKTNRDYSNDISALFDALQMFRKDFSRVGGNLNQLTHFFNSKGTVDLEDLQKNHEDLREEFKLLSQLLKKIEKEIKWELK